MREEEKGGDKVIQKKWENVDYVLAFSINDTPHHIHATTLCQCGVGSYPIDSAPSDIVQSRGGHRMILRLHR